MAYACRYLRCQPEELTEAMICACLASVSDTAVIPLADWLHLGSEARINTPSTQGSNWQWRLTCPLPEALAGHIAQLTFFYRTFFQDQIMDTLRIFGLTSVILPSFRNSLFTNVS